MLTEAHISQMARDYYAQELEIDIAVRRSSGDPDIVSSKFLSPLRETLRTCLSGRTPKGVAADDLSEGDASRQPDAKFCLVADVARELVSSGRSSNFGGPVVTDPANESPLQNVDVNSEEFRSLCQALLRARLEATERQLERDSGDFTGHPKDTLLTVSAPEKPSHTPVRAVPSFETLLDQFFIENHDLAPKYVREFRDSIDWLREYFGSEKLITEYTDGDIVDYKNALMRVPSNYRKFFLGSSIREAIKLNETHKRPTLSTTSINNKRLGNVDRLFEWCRKNKVISENPARGIRVDIPRRSKHKKKRDPFTAKELNAVFSAPLFVGCRTEHYWKEPGSTLIRDHRFWLPLLALWTGGRQGELAQLLVEDVTEIDGISCIVIADDDDGQADVGEAHRPRKRLKNQESKRIVPVHSELKALGFLSYVDAQKELGTTELFPDCELGADGSYSPYSKHFRRLLDSLGIGKRVRTVFHSFRHSFQDALREAGLTDSVQDALAGRTSGHSREGYGRGYSAIRLSAEIEKIAYPSLDLTHLHKK
tara:strand:+ start:3804 stop:5417 length:1614 start_codon:yes stop_codon:yes gene_type:complete